MKHAAIFCGDRNWEDQDPVLTVMAKLPAGTLVIHGGARGVDVISGLCAHRLGLPYCEVPYFSHLGKGGGPARNRVMAELLVGLAAQGYDVQVVAFKDDLDPKLRQGGTESMVKIAKSMGLRVKVVRHAPKKLPSVS